MSGIEELSPDDVLRLGAAIEGACKHAELTMPPHGPRRLAHCIRSLTVCLLGYFRQSLGSRNELFAGWFRRIHEEFLDLLRSPDARTFPTELILPLKEVLCRIGGYEEGGLSFAVISQPQYNFGIRGMNRFLESELAKAEFAVSLDRPQEVQAAIDSSPADIVLLMQPAAESRDVLSATMLLHEVGHAIDFGLGISSSLLPGDMPLPGGVESPVTYVIRSWLMECVADLVAARLFGPCAVFSLRRLSLLVQTMDTHSNDHPSSRARLALMLEHLNSTAYGMGYQGDDAPDVSELLKDWEGQCLPAFTESPPEPTHALAHQALFAQDTRVRLHEAVCNALPEATFASSEYKRWVGEAARDLRSGIPPQIDGKSEEIMAAIFNAAWQVCIQHASRPLDFLPADDEEGTAMALEALHGLALKEVEASFALRHWRSWARPSAAEASPPEQSCLEAGMVGAVLSEGEIRKRLYERKDLRIVPLLDPRRQISKCAVDLRLGSHFIVTTAGDVTHFEPSSIDEATIHKLQEPVTKGLGYGFVLHPNRLVLGATLEYIALPDDLAAFVVSRSSYGRLGLLVATAVFVHAGWKGCLTLELANESEVPIKLRCGEAVAQLVLLRADRLPYVPRPSPRSGLCPIRPQLPKLASKEEFSVLDAFAKMLGEA